MIIIILKTIDLSSKRSGIGATRGYPNCGRKATILCSIYIYEWIGNFKD